MPKIVMMRLTVPNGLNIMKSPAAAMRIGTTYIIAGMGMRLLERISATISEMLAKSNMMPKAISTTALKKEGCNSIHTPMMRAPMLSTRT